ncbi:hypothetical protein [Actinoplanes sp. NPDC026670]|uniref:hypothetical protein n=1 Tax=Actinoplanes sp. NPDC026670 TaxID=3154700 RepID=UPI0033D485A1
MSRVELVREVADPVLDVVFIHGLDGDGRKTWSNGSKEKPFWPAWLAEELEDVAVWAVHYDAWKVRYRGHSMPIKDRAMNIAALLGTEDIGERPLCFVAHSMGGLLVKEILMHSARGSTEFRTFATTTVGVVFLATPHDGSSLATALDAFRRLGRTTPAVEDLRRESSALLALGNEYRDWAVQAGIEHQVYFERRPTKGVFVVQPSSGNPGLPGVPPIGIDANHSGICKPQHRKELVYARVKKFVGSLVAQVTRPPPADLPDFVPRPIHGREEIVDYIEAVLDRPGTVLAELSGVAGIGKTAIATQIARKAARRDHVAYLSAHGFPGVTANAVLMSLAEAVTDGRDRDRLCAELPTPEANAVFKLDEILGCLGTDRVLVIVDDAERLQDDEHLHRDSVLNGLLTALAGRRGHQVRILFVTADLFQQGNLSRRDVPRGLAREPFAGFLAYLDGEQPVLQGTMSPEELWRSLDGHPRMAELIYGIRASGSLAPVRRLASIPATELLGSELMDSLNGLDRQIVTTLAVFGRPVLAAGVSALTGAPEDEVRAGLARLHKRRIVRRGRDRYALPPADGEHLTAEISDAELAGLRQRAAAYFEKAAESRKPKRLDDLGDHLDAIDLYVLAGDTGHALNLMSDLDRSCLKEWGQTGMLVPWLRRLTREGLTDLYDQVVNTSLLARALAQQGNLRAGIEFTQAALDINATLGFSETQLSLLLQMARYLFRLGAVRSAAGCYQEVLGLSGAGFPVAQAHLGLALCAQESAEFDSATHHLDEADDYLARCEGVGTAEPLLGARILFARACASYELDGYRRCRELLVCAREMAHENKGRVLVARCDDLLARTEWWRGDLEAAATSAKRACRAGVEAGDPYLRQLAQITLAVVRLRQGNVEEAMAAASTASLPAGTAGAAEASVLLGIVLTRTGADDERAIRAFTDAAEWAGELLIREPSRYLVREVRGLALAGQALLDPAQSEMPALLTFQRAIGPTDKPGPRHRRRELFGALVAGRSDETLPQLRDLLE